MTSPETSAREPVAPDTSSSATPKAHWMLGLLVLLIAVAVTLLHVQRVQFFCDDSYISYRYAKNLADGHGLVYNPGERVEGYTNFLWVVLLAAGLAAGLTAETWSLILGVVLLAATYAATWFLARRLLRGSSLFASLTTVVLASLGPIVLWATSGLETICFTAFVLAAVCLYETGRDSPRKLLLSGLVYALSTMVRPDGVVFGAATGLHLMIHAVLSRWESRALLTRAGALAGGFFLTFVPFLLWRHSYYDDWLPNTFYVKAGSAIGLSLGLQYLKSFVEAYPGLWLMTVAGALAGAMNRDPLARRGAGHVLLLIALFSGYIAWAGGDYMALYRFTVPLLPFVAVLVVLALQVLFHQLKSWIPHAVARAALVVMGVAALCSWNYQPTLRSTSEGAAQKVSFVNSVNIMRRNSAWWVEAGKELKRTLWNDATIATTAAGAIPYYAEVSTIDQSGLCDRHVAKVEWDPWIMDRPGHMKQASRRYLQERRPDLILWHPHIRAGGSIPRVPPPSPDYVPRSLAIPALPDENGNPLYLFFWLRRDRIGAADQAGMVDPRRVG